MNAVEANEKNLEYWDNYFNRDIKREEIVYDDWLDNFKEAIDESERPAIDLGCGNGANTLYLLEHGKSVVPCDGSMSAIRNIRKNFPEVRESICFDMLEKFPFGNNMADLIVADLSLHYFSREDTIKILKEIKRILVNRGHLLMRVNSLDDENYMDGLTKTEEENLYMTADGRYKRFFETKDFYEVANLFDIKAIRDSSTKRYGLEKKALAVDFRNRK